MQLNRLFKPVMFVLLLFFVPVFVFAQTATPLPLPSPTIVPTSIGTLIPTPTPFALLATQPYPTPFPSPTMIFDPSPTYTPEQAVPFIPLGEMVRGTLREGSRFLNYRFYGESGQVISMRFAIRDTLPSLTLSTRGYYGYPYPQPDARGNLVVNLVAVLPYTGEHMVVVDDYVNSGSANPREFTLTLAEAPERPIAYGQVVNGALSSRQPAVVYTFAGRLGDIITAQLSSPGFSPQLALALRGPDGGARELYEVSSPDYTVGGGVEMPLLQLPADGEYLLLVRRFGTLAMGRYQLRLTQVEAQPITIGETVEIALNQPVNDAFLAFEARGGEIIDVSAVAAAENDPEITLYGPGLNRMQSDDDSGGGLNPELLRVVMAFEGVYLLHVRAYGESQTAMTLAVMPSSGTLLNDAPIMVRLNKTVPMTYVYDANEGETLRFSMQMFGGGLTPPINILQGMRMVVSFPPAPITRYSADFVVPEDGPIWVTVEVPGYVMSGTAELRIEPVP